MKPKRKGIEWERSIMKRLVKLGYYATRSRASFGFFDVWAFHPFTGKVLLIQAKYTTKDFVRFDKNLEKANEIASRLKELKIDHIRVQLWVKFASYRKIKIIDLPTEKKTIFVD